MDIPKYSKRNVILVNTVREMLLFYYCKEGPGVLLKYPQDFNNYMIITLLLNHIY